MSISELGKAEFQCRVQENVLRHAEDDLAEALGVFVEFYRQAREERKVSLREAAKKLRISPAYLSDIELKRRPPNKGLRERMIHSL